MRLEHMKFSNSPKERDKLHELNASIFEKTQLKLKDVQDINPYMYGFDRSMLLNGFNLPEPIDFQLLPDTFRKRFYDIISEKIMFLLMRTSKRIYKECYEIHGLDISWLFLLDNDISVIKKSTLKVNGEIDLSIRIDDFNKFNFDRLNVSQHLKFYGKKESNHKLIIEKIEKLNPSYKEFVYMTYIGKIDKLVNLIHPKVRHVDLTCYIQSETDIKEIFSKLINANYIV